MSRIKISVVIVKYHSDKYLDDCIKSVKPQKPNDIIVVDNDLDNRGYGGGCNYGALQATGDILFFLNPDTKLLPGCLSGISEHFSNHPKVSIIGPALYTDSSLNNIQLSCCRKSGLFTSLVVYGKIQRWYVNNPWWRYFTYLEERASGMPFTVDVVSGAALAIRNSDFKAVNGFDPKIFLYYEENDLCLRVKDTGKQVVYLPEAKVIHYGGGSMDNQLSLKTSFETSRRYYFTKHYPKNQAMILNMLLK